MSTVDKYYFHLLWGKAKNPKRKCTLNLPCLKKNQSMSLNTISSIHCKTERRQEKITEQLGDINVVMHLQILKTNMKRRVRHMLGRIKIFSLLESKMIKDGWRNGRMCNGGKSNHATSYKEELKVAKIKQNILFLKH